MFNITINCHVDDIDRIQMALILESVDEEQVFLITRKTVSAKFEMKLKFRRQIVELVERVSEELAIGKTDDDCHDYVITIRRTPE